MNFTQLAKKLGLPLGQKFDVYNNEGDKCSRLPYFIQKDGLYFGEGRQSKDLETYMMFKDLAEGDIYIEPVIERVTLSEETLQEVKDFIVKEFPLEHAIFGYHEEESKNNIEE